MTLIKRTPVIVLFLVFFLLGLVKVAFADPFKVTCVFDGETLKAVSQDKEITVRLVGIDAPEIPERKHQPVQPFSLKSAKYLSNLVLHKTIYVQPYGEDSYGFTLGVVYVDGKNINLEMLNAGLAEVYRGQPASGLDLDPYWRAEKEARKARLNMWSLYDNYISPRKWRWLHK